VRFLDPSNILTRLQADVEDAVARVASGALDPDAGQTLVSERLHQIGTIVIKSLDRTDRSVALEGIWIFKRLLDFHGTRKAAMPARWFLAERADFVGLSHEALELVTEERVFFERKVLQQLFLAYQHALSKASDAVSSISDANRVAAMAAAQREDEAALQLSIRYFNNFLREATKTRHLHSVYDVFYQYRLLATALAGRAGLVAEVARHLASYAELARGSGLPFVVSFAAFDLAALAVEAREAGCPGARSALESALSLPHERDGTTETLVLAAKLKLGGAMTRLGDEECAARVREDLAAASTNDIRRAEAELLDAPRTFHEVTDRQVDLRWISPEARDALRTFVAGLTRG
jgi:hypothetical protein